MIRNSHSLTHTQRPGFLFSDLVPFYFPLLFISDHSSQFHQLSSGFLSGVSLVRFNVSLFLTAFLHHFISCLASPLFLLACVRAHFQLGQLGTSLDVDGIVRLLPHAHQQVFLVLKKPLRSPDFTNTLVETN